MKKILVDSTISGGTSSVILRTDNSSLNVFEITKYGSTSPTSSAGIPFANAALISVGVSGGPLISQVRSNQPMYFLTNNTLNMTLEADGDLELKNSLTAPDSGDADMKAYIYGSTLNSNGGINTNRSSGGFSVVRQTTGQYRITFDNSPGNIYIATVSVVGTIPRFATVNRISNYFDVYVWTNAGVATDSVFNFVVYKR